MHFILLFLQICVILSIIPTEWRLRALTVHFTADICKLEYTESFVEHPVLWESHCHSQYEMIAVAEGDITVLLEGQSYRLQKNQVIIIPPLSYHSVTANKEGSYQRITALFDAEAVPKALRSVFVRQFPGVFPSIQAKGLQELCQKEDVAFYEPLAQSLMVQLFYDSLNTQQRITQTDTDDLLQKALHYIEQHLHEKIVLDDLAKHTARSKSSFCHLFEEKMNISPKQYILQKKLALANKLISEGVPRTVAASRVGYDNYSNFYRLCKKSLME